MTNNVISIDKLEKRYSNFHLNGISFDIPKGYITGFIGPNGSGKTTTMKILLSLIKKDSGEIKVFGKETNNQEYLQDVGVVMDSTFLVKEWTISNVENVVSSFYSRWNHTMFWKYMDRFRINKNLKVKELSRGMTMKLMLAIALSHDAALLILDEPTSGLDPVAREEICEILQEYVSDDSKSVLFSTHITTDLESIADYIVFILDGDLIYSGTKDELLESYVVLKGGLTDLNELEDIKLFGLKKNSNGFEAMIHANDVKSIKGLLVEKITLDQLIVFFNRGGYHE